MLFLSPVHLQRLYGNKFRYTNWNVPQMQQCNTSSVVVQWNRRRTHRTEVVSSNLTNIIFCCLCFVVLYSNALSRAFERLLKDSFQIQKV